VFAKGDHLVAVRPKTGLVKLVAIEAARKIPKYISVIL
jgi:hypothetical protein